MNRVVCVIPSYNQSEYIGATIQSIIGQTYKDWTLIIIDDRSTDDSLAVIRQFNRNRKILVFTNKRNIGSNRTVERGWTLALELKPQPKYLIQISSDNIFHKNAFSEMVKALNKNTVVGYVYSDYYIINDCYDEDCYDEVSKVDTSTFHIPMPEFDPQRLAWGSTWMIRAELFAQYRLCGLRTGNVGDFWLAAHYAQYTNFKRVPLPLIYVRRHDDSHHTRKYAGYRKTEYKGSLYQKLVRKCEDGKLIHRPTGERIRLVSM